MRDVLRVCGVALVIAACGPTEVTNPDGGRAGGAGGGSSMDAGASGGGSAGGSAGGAAGGAAQVVSFSSQVAPILAARCGTCHATGTTAEADAFVRGTSSCGGPRIVASNAMTSLIFQKISGTQTCGAQMPLGCTPGTSCLPTVQVELIRDWLNAGAPNN